MIGFLKKIVRLYRDRWISDLYGTRYTKRVLISYITGPFRRYSTAHSNHLEVKVISKVFHDLGYSVDVIQYTVKLDGDFFKDKKYDVLFGFGDAYNEALLCKKNSRAIKIAYATGALDSFQNNAEINRIKELYLRKLVFLKPRRIVKGALGVYFNLSDAVIVIGNHDFTAKTFARCNVPLYPTNLPIFLTDSSVFIKRDFSEAKKNFLWFGSSGLVHKGLDLCLDVFSKLNDYHLHICGPQEDDFFNLYKNELQLQNIHYHGFVDIKSAEFESIVTSCAFTLFPSCSEGMCGSLLTAMSMGLIPIATKETGIDRIADFGIEVNGNIESIQQAINKVENLDESQLEVKSKGVAMYTVETFTEDNFYNQLENSIKTILIKE